MLKELRSLVKEKLQRRSTRNTLNGVKIDQKTQDLKSRQERVRLRNYKRQLMQRLFSSYVTELQGAATRSTTDEADFKAAGEIRAKEASDFTALEKELTEIVDTLNRAIGLLERHASIVELLMPRNQWQKPRGKEAATCTKEKTEYAANSAALGKAIAALESA